MTTDKLLTFKFNAIQSVYTWVALVPEITGDHTTDITPSETIPLIIRLVYSIWPQLWPRCLRLQYTNSPSTCMITMYGKVIYKPQITYLNTYHFTGKVSGKSVTTGNISITPSGRRNRNNACRNIKHEVSIDSVTAKTDRALRQRNYYYHVIAWINNHAVTLSQPKTIPGSCIRTGAWNQIRLRPDH